MKLRAFFLAMLLTVAGCEQTPTGRSQLALVSESVMTDMGRQAFARMRQSRPVSADTSASTQVQCVARETIAAAARLYPASGMPESWEAVVFENPAPNAFAVPGGHIGVHTGLLGVAENEAQLAAVIGHEVGHLLADHGNERLTQQLGVKAALMLVGLFGDIRNEQLLQALGLGARLGVTLPFSRAHEREADTLGLKIMAAAGFRPSESVALWRNMARAGGEQPLEFLSTHPAHDTRIENLESQMGAAVERFRQARAAGCSA